MLSTINTPRVPGIYTSETDLSYYASNSSATTVGMVGTANRGPINSPQLISTPEEFIRIFGAPDVNSFGSYAAIEYLRNGSNLWYSRVGNAATNGSVAAYALSSHTFQGAGAVGGVKLFALTPGTWGDRISIKVDADVVESGATQTFTVKVYFDGTLRETHVKLNVLAGDARNIETYLGAVVSESNGTVTKGKSNFVVAKIVIYSSTLRKAPATKVLTALSGGASGLAPTVAEVNGAITDGVRTGLQVFRNSEESDINLLCVPGETDDDIIAEMIDICTERGDCLAILDLPVASSATDAVAWQDTDNEERAFLKTSFAAAYWPWIQVDDLDSGQKLLLPPSGFVVSQMAYNDKVGFPWFAPAGLNRGRITTASGVEFPSSPDEREALYGSVNAINPIVMFKGQGVVIFGQKTLQKSDTALDRVNVRRLMLHLRKIITSSTQYLLFEPNDERTWEAFKSLVDPILSGIKANRGIDKYRIKLDRSTVTVDAINNNQMPGKIFITPVETAEVITLDFALLPNGANFDNF